MLVLAARPNLREPAGGPQSAAGRRGGLTLVEVLIALTVLAVVLLPVMIGFSQALITTSQSSITTAASSIARARVEDLKAVGYDNTISQGRAAASLKPGDSYFEVQTDVTEIEPNDSSLGGLKMVVVTVYQAGSQSPLVTLTTYITPSGV